MVQEFGRGLTVRETKLLDFEQIELFCKANPDVKVFICL